MMMPNRTFSAGSGYRYGFNGKENDNEVKGEGNEVDYGARVYDARIGKFLSVDPIAKKYPWYSPYHFGGNNPIHNIDLDGLEECSYGQRLENQWIPQLANGKITKEQYERNLNASAIGGAIGVGAVLVTADIVYNQGRGTKFVSGFISSSLFWGAQYHNPARNPEEARERGREALNAYSGMALGWGVNKIVGAAVTFFTPIKEEVKYLFRGTSEGFEGSKALQNVAMTPTSSDPAVATIFAIQAKNSGKGVLQIALPKDLQGVEYSANVLQSMEKEIALGLKPTEFAAKTTLTLTADEATNILKNMGIKLPSKISLEELSDVLKKTPKLSRSQIDEFYKQAVKLKKP